MVSFRYIYRRKGTVLALLGLLLICIYYRHGVFKDDPLSFYLSGLTQNMYFVFFPIFYYYLLNLYHRYIKNRFVMIRTHHLKKRQVIEETILVGSYAIVVWTLQWIPILSQFRLEALIYTLDIALFNFALFLLTTHLIGILSLKFSFYNVFSAFAIIEGFFFIFFLYGGIIDISVLASYPNARQLFSLIAIMLSIILAYFRMRDADV